MKTGAIFPVLVAFLGGGLLFQATDGFRAVTTEAARRLAVAQDPIPVPDILLESMDGKTVSLHPNGNETVLVEFIYTTCPVVCQEAAIDFARIRDALTGTGATVRLLSISFDPARDTQIAMTEYGAAHGADGTIWTVARPDPADLDMLLAKFGITVITDDWLGYQHNAAIHLVNSDGRLAGIYDINAVHQVIDGVLSSHD